MFRVTFALVTLPHNVGIVPVLLFASQWSRPAHLTSCALRISAPLPPASQRAR